MDFMVFSSQIKQPYMLVRFKFHVKCKAIQFYFGGKSWNLVHMELKKLKLIIKSN